MRFRAPDDVYPRTPLMTAVHRHGIFSPTASAFFASMTSMNSVPIEKVYCSAVY
jgi:hypothetical protein